MATLVDMTMGDLNQDRKPIYSLFQKAPKSATFKESTNGQIESHPQPLPLADTPTNIPVKKGKAEKETKRPVPVFKEKGIPSHPTPSNNFDNEDTNILEIDPNEGRRKRRKTASPPRENDVDRDQVVEEESMAKERPRRSGRESAAIFYGFAPPPEDIAIEEPSESNKIPDAKTTPPKRRRPKKKLQMQVIKDDAVSGVVVDSGRALHDHPTSKAEGQMILEKPTKLLKFNPKTGTIGSPPAKKVAIVAEKKGKKAKSHMVIVQYGEDLRLPASTGEKIDQILNGSLSILARTKKPLIPTKPIAPKQPPKNLHPLFMGKPAAKATEPTTSKPAVKKSCIIDLTGPSFPKLKSPKRSTMTSPTFAAFGTTSKTLKFPGSVEPAWPWQGMVHVRGLDSETLNGFPAVESPIESRCRKSKYTATQIPNDEHLLFSVAADLNVKDILKSVAEINLNDYPPLPHSLRVPTKHLESGKRIQQRIRSQVLARVECNQYPDSIEDELQAGTPARVIHPVLTKHYNTISSTLSAFDNSQFEGQSWVNKYAPQSSAEVLQAGPEALILKDWLQTLTVKSVDSGLGSKHQGKSESSEPTGKRKRKSKKDDFIVGSDDDFDFDELTEPDEDNSLQGHSSARKTVVRGNKGKEMGKLKKSVLISGPHGSGKTAAVYAVAKELGFEVFEINSSSRRSGKDIMEKVGDMTRNHQVQRKSVLSMPQVDEDVQRIEKALADDISSGRQGTMQSFLTAKAAPKPKPEVQLPAPTLKDIPKLVPSVKAPPKEQKQSLILIEEVDVLYEEDKNFWVTVMELFFTSKRPIIMTCTDESLVPDLKNALHAIIRFSPPPVDLATDYMLLVAACEGHVLQREAVKTLYKTRKHDLRASIAELDFWCQFGIGDQKHGGDWYYRRYEGKDLNSHGDKIRVVSEDTYHTGMGCFSRDILTEDLDVQNIEEEMLHELWDEWGLDAGDWQTHSSLSDWTSSLQTSTKLAALKIYNDFAEFMSVSDLCSASLFAPTHTQDLDTTIPILADKPLEKVSQDYILGRQLIQAAPIRHFHPLAKDMSIYLKSQARQHLHKHHAFPPRNEQALLSLLTNPTLVAKGLARSDLSLAFDPISYSSTSTLTSTSLEPSIFDRTTTIITLDVAPYIRGIVAYDQRLAKDRLERSNLLSEGGNVKGRKRMRTTRAAISALEGGVREQVRRERYFGNLLNGIWVARTGAEGWREAVEIEEERRSDVLLKQEADGECVEME